jgi:ribonuclease J
VQFNKVEPKRRLPKVQASSRASAGSAAREPRPVYVPGRRPQISTIQASAIPLRPQSGRQAPLSLSFYGGHHEVGGNKILLQSADGSIFLDFGKSFETESRHFEEPWNEPFHIPSLMSVGALPNIPGLYRTGTGPAPVDGILISHGHQDHIGNVPLVAGGIPVHLGGDTKALADIRNKTAQTDWRTLSDHVDWHTFRSGDQVVVKNRSIRFEPIHVDHSIPASYAFVVEAGGKRIGYTGDLRMHGRNAWMTTEFLKRLREKPLDILICEGTRLNPPGGDPDDELRMLVERAYRLRMGPQAPQVARIDCQQESDVECELVRVIGNSGGLVLIDVSPMDLDRISSVWKAASACGRTLVLPAKQAYVMHEAGNRSLIDGVGRIEDSMLLMPQRRKSRRALALGEPEDAEAMAHYPWERELIAAYEAVGSRVLWGRDGREELRENGRQYVICSPQVGSVLPELCYDAPMCAIEFILSKSEPFNEEMVFSFDKLLHWLVKYGCKRYYQIHTSGHASPADLRCLVEKANPGIVVPVHTKHPELFCNWHDRVLIPSREAGEPMWF